MATQVQLNIPVFWYYTNEVRQAVDRIMQTHPEAVRKATKMVASELVENAIKYGRSTKEIEQVSFLLVLEDKQIIIEVKNGLSDPAELAELSSRIKSIQASANREELLLKRMQEIIDNPAQGSQIGLYRIASEGGFDLDYGCDGSILTVRATREINE